MAVMQTPTVRVVMIVVITIRQYGGGAGTDSERGDDGGDHYQQ